MNNSENEQNATGKKGMFSKIFKKKSDEHQANVRASDAVEEILAEEELRILKRQKIIKEVVSWVLCIAIALGAAFVIRTWLFTVVKVDGKSMLPTLHHNERLFVRIVGYEPSKGDIVILEPKGAPGKVYVKRVIATEGDRLWFDTVTGDVHIKKKGSDKWEIIVEDYTLEEPAKNTARYKGFYMNPDLYNPGDDDEKGLLIKENHVFVMGDNRNGSNDSRNEAEVGQVHEDRIIGKVIFRWWPLSEFGRVY